jgi:hypothetical protein
MQRRHFLYSSSLACLIPFTSGLTACSDTDKRPDPSKEIIVGGYSETNEQGHRIDRHGVIVVQPMQGGEFSIISDFSVPFEVHLATFFPDQKSILVCSRKPGASLLKYSLSGALIAELKPANNQLFEGHGIFSIDEDFLYATASDYELHEGLLLKLNSQDLSLIKEYSSGGIGPHELVWQSDKLIAIANTGVLTHPTSGRKILNLDSIQSNVILFNTLNETINHKWQVSLLGLSARHLDRMDNGDLVIGFQYKKQDKRPPCIAFANKNKGLVFSDTNNETLHWGMQGYTASIKSIPKSDRALISNPRGHLLTQWQNNIRSTADEPLTAQLIDQHSIEFNKGLKITQDGQQAWVTKGAGELLSLDLSSHQLNKTVVKVKQNIWWANHLG